MANLNNAQNNSRDNQTNVNTNGPQFSNRDGFDPSTLQCGFWNSMISLRISPALEPSKQTESKTYDYEKTVSTAINIEKAMMLYDMITKEIIPAIEANENKDTSFQVGGDSLLAVGTGKRITEEIRPYIAIHKSLNPDTKIPETSIFYEFRRNNIIDNYDESNGSYNLVSNVHSELSAFTKFLLAGIMALTNANTHSQRHVNKFYNDKVLNTVSNVAEKVGADVYGQRSYGGYSGKSNLDFNSKPNNHSTEQVSSESIGSLEDFEKMLGTM